MLSTITKASFLHHKSPNSSLASYGRVDHLVHRSCHGRRRDARTNKSNIVALERTHPSTRHAESSPPKDKTATGLISVDAFTRRHLIAGCACGCVSLIARPAAATAGLEAIFPSYGSITAAAMENGMSYYESQIEARKQALFGMLDPGIEDVLELGLGTGPNLKYYPKGISVVGVEPNAYMNQYALEKAEACGVNLQIRRGFGENLPLEDASVDAVVGTLVMCSVSDPAMVLSEVVRVLRPGGQYIFIDHVAADPGTALLFQQRLLYGLQQFVGGGCHLTRRTGDLIQSAAQPAHQVSNKGPERLFADVKMEKFELDGDNLWLIAPHVAGVATRA
eukprot:CAMPEP_0198199928 /NCGR_PEP_ID=MMETSP1445-20131203/3035_1 /TAXON_ID=36898 /ORGANISM="Pyramimonas sp., Strain CCMP2087" /LENGTH=334 /DNA_ID=CAMNT_0043869839 /DNA_START=195 /DNA_END=1199 /DNA_ORIENTATION=+